MLVTTAPTIGRTRQPHQLRRNYDETDWPQILALYGVLDRLADDPVVTLN